MYKINRQMSIAEFISPFGELNKNNRWVRIAEMIPWEVYEEAYAEKFSDDTGAPAIPFRAALGTLIIKQRTGSSDEEVMQHILENPYMQFLIGLQEFTHEEPFSVRSVTNFRKRLDAETIDRINREIFRKEAAAARGDGPEDGTGNGCGGSGPEGGDDGRPFDGGGAPPNRGFLILDATCTPADIAFPTDEGLLNEAREKLEAIIDALHPYTGDTVKPRTYRGEAGRRHANFVRSRKPRKKTVRKATGQQLRYVRRNLAHVDAQLEKAPAGVLYGREAAWLETIRELYRQQELMHRAKTRSVPDRIVSIGQPHVRPIVRGKAKSPTEFGAKVSVSMVGGFAFVDKIAWDAYSEAELLVPAVLGYRREHGCFPEAVLADKLYRNRANLAFCKKHGIRLSGPKLGRPTKVPDRMRKLIERWDSRERNAVEGKFGEGKTRYGLDRVMARLKETSETVISLAFLCMNIGKKLRLLFDFFSKHPKYGILFVYKLSNRQLYFKNHVFS